MATIRTNKPDAARRQLEAAIRMLFSGEDPFAIHTVVGAAYRIVRDLAEKAGNTQFHEIFKQMIRPGKEKQFWAGINKAANFLKHADSDPAGVLEVEEELNDVLIATACIYYESLGYELTPIMRGFMVWCMVLNPDFFIETAPMKAMLTDSTFDQYHSKPRTEQLKLGRQIIGMVVATKASI